MTKKEFHNILSKQINECNGFELHIKHLWDNNNAKAIFRLTGLDFTDMFELVNINKK